MNQNNLFLEDLLELFHEDVDCFIQAPSLTNSIIYSLFNETVSGYSMVLSLNRKNKEIFLNQERESSFSIYIQRLEIKLNNRLLFEGYDGCEYGVISKSIDLPDWFKEKYVPERCMISSYW